MDTSEPRQHWYAQVPREGLGLVDAAWQRVADDLRRVLSGIAPLGSRVCRGALYLRLAVVGLRQGLCRHVDALTAALLDGKPGPDGASPADPFAVLEVALEAQLAGAPAGHAVLEALPPALRSSATADVARALACDPEYRPALRAAAALALADGDALQAVRYYQRLAELPGMPESVVDALQMLAHLRWRRLGEPSAAREDLLRARQLAPDDLVLVDKLLKLDLELEQWEEAAAACHHLVAQLGRGANAELPVTYLLTLGEIHLYGLKEPGAALKYYLDAVERLPGYPLSFSLIQDLMEHHAEQALGAQGTSRLLPFDDRTALGLQPSGPTAYGDPESPNNARRKHLVDLLKAAVRKHEDVAAAIRAFKGAVGFVGP